MALTPTQEAQVLDLIAQQSALLSLASNEATILSKLAATFQTLSDLSAASVVNDADLLHIRQGTTDKSVSGAIIKAASAPQSASETQSGVAEIATQAETNTGTDDSRFITPLKLATRTATEAMAGIVELATDAEAQAFTADKYIDGAKLNTAFKGSNQSLSGNGYQKLPGGLIVQWGKVVTSTGGGTPVTFPIAFPTGCYVVTAALDNQLTNYQAGSITASGFNAIAASGTPSMNWIAVGI